MFKITIKQLVVISALTIASVGCSLFQENDKPETTSADIGGLIIDGVSNETLSNVIIQLTYSDNEVVFIDTTDASGRFFFTDVPISGGTSQDTTSSTTITGTYGFSITQANPVYRSKVVLYPVTLNFLGKTGKSNNASANVVIPLYKNNIKLTGVLVDQNDGVPVKGVLATLYAKGSASQNGSGFRTNADVILDTTITQIDGKFSFEKIEQGITTFIRFQSLDELSDISIQTDEINIPVSSSDNETEYNFGSVSVNSGKVCPPFEFTGLTVDDGDDLNLNESIAFKFRFSSPVKQSRFTRTDYEFGTKSGTMIDSVYLKEIQTKAVAKVGNNYEVKVAWNTDFTELTITSTDVFKDAYFYSLDLRSVFNSVHFTDELCQPLTATCFRSEDECSDCERETQEVAFITFSTFKNTATPNTPVFAFNPNSGSPSLNYIGGTSNFQVTINNTNAPVAYYEVYRKVEGENAELVDKSFVKDDEWFGYVRFSASTGSFITGSQTAFNKAVSVEFYVKAVSENLKVSAKSNSLVIQDNVQPGLRSSVYSAVDSSVTVTFSEPMSSANLSTAAKYLVRDVNDQPIDGLTITSVNAFLDSNTKFLDTVKLFLSRKLKATESTNTTRIVATSNDDSMKDLSGNTMSTTILSSTGLPFNTISFNTNSQ